MGYCISSIAALSATGTQDGGLVVMKGSHTLHHQNAEEKLSVVQQMAAPVQGEVLRFDWYKAHAAEESKVCTGKGHFISESYTWQSAVLQDT